MELTTHLGVLRANITNLRAVLNENTAFYLMLKANAYNHGMYECAVATTAIVDGYGVATMQEGISLRQIGIDAPIVVTCPTAGNMRMTRDHKLIPMVGNFAVLEEIPIYSTIDIKVDTGMHRQGFYKEDIDRVVYICANKHINIRGLATHFSSRENACKQMDIYCKCRELMSRHGIHPLRHYVATSTIDSAIDKGDIVRVGIGAYGYCAAGVTPVLTATSTIDSLKCVYSGAKVGYDGNYIVDKSSTIALVGGGYYDGIMRAWSGCCVNIHGRQYPIIGRINMDSFCVLLGDNEYNIGDEVEIVGENNPADMLARHINTIPYEVLTSLKGDRWHRSCKF